MAHCHDTPAAWADSPMCLVRAIGDLGWDDQVEFIPYWRKQTGLAVQTPASPVVISGWQRGQGNLLVIVFNDSDQTADCRSEH